MSVPGVGHAVVAWDSAARPRVARGHARLAYRWHSGQGVTVVAVHGSLMAGTWYKRLEGQLPGCRLLEVDLPGHGASEQAANGLHDLRAMASAIRSLMEQLGIFEQEYGLMGHSLGGAVALLVARLAPRAPAFFVSIEGNTVQDDCAEVGLAREVAGLARPPESAKLLERVRQHDSPTGVWGAHAARLGESLGPLAHKLFASLVWWCDCGELLETWLSLPKVRYLCGERSGKYHVGTWASLQRHADARCIEIKGAGHFMLDEKPQESVEALRELLGGGTLPASASTAAPRSLGAGTDIFRVEDVPAVACTCVEAASPASSGRSVQLVMGACSGALHPGDDERPKSRHLFGYSLTLGDIPVGNPSDLSICKTSEIFMVYTGRFKFSCSDGHSALLNRGDFVVVPAGAQRSFQCVDLPVSPAVKDCAKLLQILPGRPLRAGRTDEMKAHGEQQPPVLQRALSQELEVEELECSEQAFLSMVHRISDKPCAAVPRGDGELVVDYIELTPEAPALHFEAQSEDWLLLALEGDQLLVNGSALRANEFCLVPRGSAKELRLPEKQPRALLFLVRSTLKRAVLGISASAGPSAKVLPEDLHRQAKRRKIAAETLARQPLPTPVGGLDGADGLGFAAGVAARPLISAEALLQLRRHSTPSVFDGWEQITSYDSARECFSLEPVVDHTPQMGPMVGYAVTVQINPGNPAVARECSAGRKGFRDFLASLPASLPKIVVVQDLDKPRILGSLWGAVDVALARALACVGCVTDGGVRDLDQAAAAGFHLVSRGTCVGSAQRAVPLRWDLPVEVFGVTVRPGQLLHVGQHGFLAVPEEDEPKLPEAVDRVASLQNKHTLRACAAGLGKPSVALAAEVEEASLNFEEERGALFAEAAPTVGSA